MYKRLKEIEGRKTEIRGLIESGSELDVQVIFDELETLSKEERGILGKLELPQKAQSGQIPPQTRGRKNLWAWRLVSC